MKRLFVLMVTSILVTSIYANSNKEIDNCGESITCVGKVLLKEVKKTKRGGGYGGGVAACFCKKTSSCTADAIMLMNSGDQVSLGCGTGYYEKDRKVDCDNKIKSIPQCGY